MDVPQFKDLNPSPRLLLGPGPSPIHPRVLRAMATPLLGHLDPEFLTLLNETQQLLRYVFQTKNELTISISGTGTAGMEAALCNLIEPGDNVLVAVVGYFGERMVSMAQRYGATVDRLDRPWGEIFDPADIEKQLAQKKYKLVAFVQAETSTGALQLNVKDIAAAAHKHGAFVVMDCVTSLGGVPVEVDNWDVDIAYSCSQKCLSCPPGLAPITVSPRARDFLRSRKTPVGNWYLDLMLLEKYWGGDHAYHHTAPITMNYALREGLRIVAEEGLDARFARHRANAEMLWAGLEEIDLPPFVPLKHRLPALTTCALSPRLDDASGRKRLLDEYNIEVAGGFGPLKGKIWRIGLMGFGSRRENITLLLAALRKLLA